MTGNVDFSSGKSTRNNTGWESNKLYPEDRAAHDWYRFVLSFPPHLVREYLNRFSATSNHQVLDPFCGTGTTIVECKKRGISSIGIEASPMAHFASEVKVDWTPDPDGLIQHASAVAESARSELASGGIEDYSLPLFQANHKAHKLLRTLPTEKQKLLLTNSISPLPLHKTLVLLDHLKRSCDKLYRRHELLALAKALVNSISNLHFGPEVGVGPPKTDAPVIDAWLSCVQRMAEDLRRLPDNGIAAAVIHHSDARQLSNIVEPASVDVVITSPPYPNEKDYTRTTRLESILLGFIQDKSDLKTLKHSLLRSNTRNVYKDDDDDQWVAAHSKVQRIAEAIEARRIELGKTSGFERLYARVTKLYFGGMARHLADLRRVLRPGAHLAYVVGDQASYLRVMIRTGSLLADIAQSLGYELIGIDLFRTRLATATKDQLREEVVILRWPSNSRMSVDNSIEESQGGR
ncbi:MAG TPA: DNA methyltransferase [Blastocatellia bacterium]|nr:DNA methyltransferase [Blastocatellia bacterium]